MLLDVCTFIFYTVISRPLQQNMKSVGKKFQSMAYATEHTESAEHIEQSEPQEFFDLNQVVIGLPNKKLLLLFLDDETFTDFEMWAETESVVSCEHNEQIPSSDDSRSERHVMDEELNTGETVHNQPARREQADDGTSFMVHTSAATVQQDVAAFETCSENLPYETTMETEDVETVCPVGNQEEQAYAEYFGRTDESAVDENVLPNMISVSCQTDPIRSTSTTGETSSDNPEIAVPRQYRRLSTRVRDRRAG